MKKLIGYLCKCMIAGVLALVVLSLFSAIYFNPPIAVEQPEGITNFKYIPDLKWSFMLEGFGSGTTDHMGYNNAYHKDSSEFDIVFVGSSHLEALHVPEDANFVYLLNEMFDQDDVAENDFKCLNLGVSGHFFEVTASNYEYIADRFQGAKYVVLEVFDAKYSPDVLDGMIAGAYRAPMEKRGFVYETLQRVPFFRLMYKKINETVFMQQPAGNVAELSAEPDMDAYVEKMNVVLDKIAKTSKENRIVPIILMHERFWEKEDGSILMETDETYKNAFQECCKTNGIKVIDVSSNMISQYRENFEFSYGFSNSAPGEGHLNETGHRIVAETVYQYINEMEALR